jgi:hypothetical protein
LNRKDKKIRKLIILTIVLFIFDARFLSAQTFSYGDHWYDNPLGFSPVKLHTSNGFFIPALAVAACLLLTEKDTALANRISYYDETGISWGYKYPYTTVYQNNTGFVYSLRKWMKIGAEISFYFPNDDFNGTAGIGIRPFARFYPINNDDWRIFFESGAGFIYFFDYFPKPTDQDNRLGTNLNGMPKYGIGGEINIYRNISILFGIRHVHVSNGNTKGVERNPSHDSNGFFIGFSYIPEK